jgi:hypothetical protein
VVRYAAARPFERCLWAEDKCVLRHSGYIEISVGWGQIETAVHHYEVLEPSTATVVARFTNTSDHAPALTINDFGKGKAIYLATESNPSVNRSR